MRVIFFFLQAEEGIRDGHVTGVQTCALPICPTADTLGEHDGEPVIQVEGAQTHPTDGRLDLTTVGEIGRASCRERVWIPKDAGSLTKKDMARTTRCIGLASE